MTEEEQKEFLKQSGKKNAKAQLKSSISMKQWLQMVEERIKSPLEESQVVNNIIFALDKEALEDVRN